MDEVQLIEELESRGYAHQFEFGEYDYSWEIWHIFTRDRRVFYLRDCGCSCYYFGESWSSAEEAEGELVEITSLSEATALGNRSPYIERFDIDNFLKLGLR